MIFPTIDYSGSGANRIDIAELEAKAGTLQQVGPYLLLDDFEGYYLLLNDLRENAARKLGNIVCGISAFFCYGTDSERASNLEKVENYSASFIGEYCTIVTITDPDSQLGVDPTNSRDAIIPTAIFSPFDRDELPPYIFDEYSILLGELYPYVAVPLVGVPVLMEKLPFHSY